MLNTNMDHLSLLWCPPFVCAQKYPPSATTLHFEFYAEPGPEVKVERKVRPKPHNHDKNKT